VLKGDKTPEPENEGNLKLTSAGAGQYA